MKYNKVIITLACLFSILALVNSAYPSQRSPMPGAHALPGLARRQPRMQTERDRRRPQPRRVPRKLKKAPPPPPTASNLKWLRDFHRHVIKRIRISRNIPRVCKAYIANAVRKAGRTPARRTLQAERNFIANKTHRIMGSEIAKIRRLRRLGNRALERTIESLRSATLLEIQRSKIRRLAESAKQLEIRELATILSENVFNQLHGISRLRKGPRTETTQIAIYRAELVQRITNRLRRMQGPGKTFRRAPAPPTGAKATHGPARHRRGPRQFQGARSPFPTQRRETQIRKPIRRQVRPGELWQRRKFKKAPPVPTGVQARRPRGPGQLRRFRNTPQQFQRRVVQPREPQGSLTRSMALPKGTTPAKRGKRTGRRRRRKGKVDVGAALQTVGE